MAQEIAKMEWLNEIISRFWPYCTEAVENLMTERIMPTVSSLLPWPLRGMQLSKFDLGEQPLIIDNITTFSDGIEEDEILTEVHFCYCGDANIVFRIKKIFYVGVQDIKVDGKLRLSINPLLPHLPLVGGISISFAEMPKFSFDFKYLAEILDFPGFSDLLDNAIKSAIKENMLLPKKIPIPIAKGVTKFDLLHTMPRGVVRIHINEARNLINGDVGFTAANRRPDPYCTLQLGSNNYETQIIKNTNAPKWDEFVDFIVHVRYGQTLVINVLDHDTVTEDDFLGQVKLDVNLLAQKKRTNTWLPLKDVKQGEIRLDMVWLSISDSVEDLQLEAIDCAEPKQQFPHALLLTNVLNGKLSKEHRCYCKVTVGSNTFTTKPTKRKTKVPRWDVQFKFLITNPSKEQAVFEMLEFESNNSLGKVTVPLSNLLTDDDKMTFESTCPLEGGQSEKDDSLHLEIILRVLYYEGEDLSSDEELPSDSENDNAGDLARPANSEIAPRGSVQLTLQESSSNSSLLVLVHSASDLPVLNQSGSIDSYVRAYLLPDRGKDDRKRTSTVNNDRNPAFGETFEFPVTYEEAKSRTLEVAVKSVTPNKTVGRVRFKPALKVQNDDIPEIESALEIL